MCLEHQDKYILGKWGSSGATEHTQSYHEKFDWLHLETVAKFKTLLEKEIRESLQIKHLEVKTEFVIVLIHFRENFVYIN